MADAFGKDSHDQVQIVGNDSLFAVDVVLEDGKRKLAITDQTVRIESLAGVQEAATTYFFITSVADGQTLTLTLQAGAIAPLYTKTFTVGVGETKYEFADRIILELNQDFVGFQPYYRALSIEDNAAVFLLSKTIGEAGELPNDNDFTITGTVPVVINTGFDKLLRRSATVQAALSSKDPRLSIFGIQGIVETRSANVSGIVAIQPYANGDMLQIDLNINGNGTPVEFTFPMDALDDYFIDEIRLFGLDSNISFGKFLGRNSSITEALQLEIKSDNSTVTFPYIETTDDFADKFAGNGFDLFKQSGSDKFIASFKVTPFPLRRQGTFGVGNDDYLKITVGAQLSQVTKLQAICIGVRREA